MINTWLHKHRLRLAELGIAGMLFWFLFPAQLFHDPYATIVLSAEDELIAAQIAEDEQWRFPEVDSVPFALEQAICLFEDEYFRFHPGVNPISMIRAVWQNLREGRTVSGGSTLSMQVIRISRKGSSRTILEKLLEMYLAIRMEFSFSKDEILKMYVSHAPYGGNVVGVEAAAWRYFNRPLERLSWAEYCTLAILPNAPSLMHPGKNRVALVQKRNRLLLKLLDREIIDSTTYSLACMEPIPDQPGTLPSDAWHLLSLAKSDGMAGERVRTTVMREAQRIIAAKVDRYVHYLAQNQVHNASAMVVSLKTGDVLAYVGNASDPATRSPYVDIIQRPRSSGSILKPFLYALAMQDGRLNSRTLLRDIPVTIGNFSPENFDRSFEGAVTAHDALTRSLNVPATLLLRDYGLPLFHQQLQNLGFSTITQTVENYGLTLILGGAEVSTWDLARAYLQSTQHLLRETGVEVEGDGMRIWRDGSRIAPPSLAIDPGAWFLVSRDLLEVQRPDINKDWKRFSSSRRISWKTGTSHGFRDAWAVGYDGEILVLVWAGNADGEGRPGLTGVSTAAPLMFEIFEVFPQGEWFHRPDGYLRQVEICAASGYAPREDCPRVKVDWPVDAPMCAPCPYHERILLNEQGERVYHQCATGTVRDTLWFALDPVTAYFYARRHSNYRPVPAFSRACASGDVGAVAIIYPAEGSNIILPRDFDRSFERLQLKATHADRGKVLFWHLDGKYLGETSATHEMLVDVEVGKHTLLVIDEQGNQAACSFSMYKG